MLLNPSLEFLMDRLMRIYLIERLKTMTNKNSTVGRKCSICTHDELETINDLIGRKSFRAISRQIQDNDSMRDSIRRHAENCKVFFTSESESRNDESADFSDKPQNEITLLEVDVKKEQQVIDSPARTDENAENLSQTEKQKKNLQKPYDKRFLDILHQGDKLVKWAK